MNVKGWVWKGRMAQPSGYALDMSLAHPRPDAPRHATIHTHNPVVNQSPSHPIYGACLEYSAGKECESLACFFSQGGEPGSGFSDN